MVMLLRLVCPARSVEVSMSQTTLKILHRSVTLAGRALSQNHGSLSRAQVIRERYHACIAAMPQLLVLIAVLDIATGSLLPMMLLECERCRVPEKQAAVESGLVHKELAAAGSSARARYAGQGHMADQSKASWIS